MITRVHPVLRPDDSFAGGPVIRIAAPVYQPIAGWVGWFLGNMILTLIWSYPLYLIGVLFAERLTLLPDTSVEWVIWGGLAFVLFLLARGKGRPDHLEPEYPGRPRPMSDRALRSAVARGEMTGDEAVVRSMGFNSQAEVDAWMKRESSERGDERDRGAS